MMKTLIILVLSASVSVVVSNKAALNGFITASNRFASDLYSQFSKNTANNFIVSPLSAEVILTLTQSGCKGETRQEMKNVLHLPDNQEEINLGVKELQFNKTDLYTFVSANKMYVKKDYTIKEEFKNVGTNVYQVEVENVDFEKNVEASRIMNEWVQVKTHNKIKDLMDPSTIDKLTRVILINALYFKGDWLVQFFSSYTETGDFHKLDGSVVKVNMMRHVKDDFNFYESDELNAKFLKLPFKGEDAAMIVVLPNEKDGLAQLEKRIDRVFSNQPMEIEWVHVYLPKFKIENTIQLKDILKNLGMQKAFKKGEADLSGISGTKGELAIDDLVQKAFIKIDEKGVEAAAAARLHSSVISGRTIRPKMFVADHPFVFFIKVKNFIIFAGRVVAP